MDKNRFIIFALLLGIGLAVMYWMKKPVAEPAAPTTPEQAARPQPATQPATQSAAAPPVAATRPTTGPARATTTKLAPTRPAKVPQWIMTPGEHEEITLGSTDPASGYEFAVALTSRGAAVDTVKLANYFETVADTRLFARLDRDHDAYLQKVQQNPEKYKGHYTVLHPIVYGGWEFYAYETAALTIRLDEDKEVRLSGVRTAPWTVDAVSKDETKDTQSVTYRCDLSRQAPGEQSVPMLSVYKTFTIRKKSYSIEMDIRLVNHTQGKLSVDLDQAGPIGLTREDNRSDLRTLAVGRLEEGKLQIDLTHGVNKLINKDTAFGKPKDLGRTDSETNAVAWIAYVNKYFGSFCYLRPRQDDLIAAATYQADFQTIPAQAGPASGPASGRVWRPMVLVQALALSAETGEQTLQFDLFTGPKSREVLNQPDMLYSELQYADTVELGRSCFCTFDWLRVGLMNLLDFFAKYLFGNYGLAIMLLVGLVRLVLHPLTKKGQVSIARMQKSMAAMKPKLDKLKDKYKDDRETLQKETMKLYRENNASMSGMLGCLPMLLQMPIWVALFTGLNTSVELRHEGFLPVWITDLSSPDQLFTWSSAVTLPLIGNSFNLLPILLVVAMYLQSKFNPAMGGQTATMTAEQQQQQKMMKIMMPLMMLLFFYNAPSGLTLYIMSSTTIGLIEQHVIRKHIREQEELEKQTETVVDAGGRGPRGNRPKKPKNPFRMK